MLQLIFYVFEFLHQVHTLFESNLPPFLIKYKIDKVGVFTYSREEGTPAYNYDGQIDEEIKISRRDALMKIQQEIVLVVHYF